MFFKRTILTMLGMFGSIFMISVLITGNAALYAGTAAATEPQPETRPPDLLHSDPKENLSFPYPIEGTDLLIETVICYDGPFLEDGSGREMKNVTAILLKNTGNTGILSAWVNLQSADGIYCFYAEDIPPDGSALVLESVGKQFRYRPFHHCAANAVNSDSLWLRTEEIYMETVAMDTLAVTNKTDRTLHHIQIFYKSIYAGGVFYLGGRSYNAVLTSLPPGETVYLTPDSFAGSYSGILRVSFEEE